LCLYAVTKSKQRKMTQKSFVTPAAYSVAEALVRLNLSRDTFYKLIREGRLSARKVGRKTLVLDTDLRAFLEGLPKIGGGTQ
jgi:excisionase family DNA binding protein